MRAGSEELKGFLDKIQTNAGKTHMFAHGTNNVQKADGAGMIIIHRIQKRAAAWPPVLFPE